MRALPGIDKTPVVGVDYLHKGRIAIRKTTALLAALLAAACGSVNEQTVEPARALVAGKTLQAGIGDTVLDLKVTEPLPNAFGKADLFGRTRDAGRIVVKYLGARDGRAWFGRRDIAISSNDTTMSRSPTVITSAQQSAMTGNFGTIPISAQQSTAGVAIMPAQPSTSSVTGVDTLALSAPEGGSVLIEGRTLTVLRIGDGQIAYSVR